MDSNRNQFLEAALAYAAKGIKVVALHSPVFEDGTVKCSCKYGVACSSIGKHPRYHHALLAHGLKDATTDPEIIKKWWALWPDANVAAVTGAESNLTVVDIDIDKETGEFVGLATLEKIEAIHGVTPATLEVETGSGGRQRYYLHPGVEVRNSQSEDAIDHVDFRGDGGYVVAPPSIHASGRPYAFVDESKRMVDLPTWALNWRIAKIKPFAEVSVEGEEKPQVIEPPAPALASMNGKKAKYVEAVYRAELARVTGAASGGRNNALNDAAFRLFTLVGAGELDDETVSINLADAAKSIGLEDDEIEKTLKSARDAGMRNPRDMSNVGSKAKGQAAPAAADEPLSADAVAPEAQAAEEKPEKATKPTDDELAGRWIAKSPLVAHGMGFWRRYADGWWQEVDPIDIDQELLAEIVAAKAEGIRPTSGRLESVRNLAKTVAGKKASTWDANPDIIVCRNGTIDIPTLTLREWNADDFMTSAVSYDFDPDATCPNFLRAINESVPEAHDLLQEFAGYALTTDTRFELALWLFGVGGSGKSTVIEGFKAMLGQGKYLNLGLSDIESSRFALYKLPGKTLAISTEQPSGLLKATDVLNKIISGEEVRVEQKFQNHYDITPRAKLLWAMNELPRVSDPNNGLFRRVKIIKFPPRAAELRDVDLKERVKLEGAGILNWALEGLARLRARGRFVIPAGVEDATKEFKESNDIPAKFIEECCLVGDDETVVAGKLYSAYKEWAIENGHKSQSSTTIAEDWKRLGFTKGKSGSSRVWRGVGLLVNESEKPFHRFN